MLKKIIITLLLSISSVAWAADTYNSATNELTINSVLYDNKIYTNVIIKVGSYVQINGGAPNGSMDIYNSETQRLFIPSVISNGLTYTNVVVSVGRILFVGGITPFDGTTTDPVTANSSSVLVTSFISIN
ncbi:hypothetical protein [Limnohabitans sp.]|uniref:hypothetical protein n=1 Tax=Limnohabitans sp. TaxID=1907725 RepID=UPI002AFEA1A4|nr:hypothetical protein [Limnohabitans sp.]